MAYDKTLRVRKKVAEGYFHGKFGDWDFTDEPIQFKKMTKEMLVDFAKLHDAATVKFHLIGEIPVTKTEKKELSPKPKTDGEKEKK